MRLKDMASRTLLSGAKQPPIINQSFQEISKANFSKIEIGSLSSNSEALPKIENNNEDHYYHHSIVKSKTEKKTHRKEDSVTDWINCSNNEIEKLIKENEENKIPIQDNEEGKRLTTEEINFIFE